MMGPVLLALIFTLGALGLIYLFGGKSRGRNYPHGPSGLPVFGNLLHLGRSPHKKITEWRKEFGPIMALDFGSFPAVVITDAKLIRAAFNEPDFLGRPAFPLMKDRSGGEPYGVTYTSGKHWLEQRKFIIRILRDCGFGKKSLETIFQEEIQELIDRFRLVGGKAVSTESRFNGAVLNVMWSFITGERFKKEDPELRVAIKHFTTNMKKKNLRASISTFIPSLLKIFPKLSGYQELLTDIFPILDFLKKPMAHHSATFQDGQPRDFIDAYLEEIYKTTESGSSFYKEIGEKSLLFVVYDLLVAGVETTSTALIWIVLYMAKYPKIQKKLQEEIEKVIGNSRIPNLADRGQMHFTEAVVHEVLRISSVTPFGVAHSTNKDLIFERFTIPKNTMIIPNIYGVHFDEEIWGDPEYFRPQRFLNRRGEFKKNDNFLAFSAGKRACLGESMARDELFLFTVSLFQVFTVKPSGCEELSIEHKLGGTLAPLPHKLIFKERW